MTNQIESNEVLNILSIDAWGNEEEGWEWNAWYKIDVITQEEFESLNVSNYINWFIEKGYIRENDIDLVFINDDGCNIILCDAETKEPLYAIDYSVLC